MHQFWQFRANIQREVAFCSHTALRTISLPRISAATVWQYKLTKLFTCWNVYQMAHLHSRAGVKTLSTQTPLPPAADHKQQGFPLKAVDRNFGGVNPSAFQKWYQHLTNVQQLPAGETSKQADKVEGRVLFWLCKNFLAWDATDRFAMAAQQKADSLYTVSSLVWSKEFLPFP